MFVRIAAGLQFSGHKQLGYGGPGKATDHSCKKNVYLSPLPSTSTRAPKWQKKKAIISRWIFLGRHRLIKMNLRFVKIFFIELYTCLVFIFHPGFLPDKVKLYRISQKCAQHLCALNVHTCTFFAWVGLQPPPPPPPPPPTQHIFF